MAEETTTASPSPFTPPTPPDPLALPDGPVLVIAAHPDDPEFGCGGSIARLVNEGRDVIIAVVTDGTEGNDDPAIRDDVLRALREDEQRAAAAALGVTTVEFLRFPDGRLEATLPLRRALTRLIRQYRPATIFTHDPTSFIDNGYINHPDHRATGQGTLDALYPAVGNPRSFRELLAEGLTAHKVGAVYMFYTHQADAWVDITTTLDQKAAALRCHKSQIAEPDKVIEWVTKWAQHTGEESQHHLQAAEGFRRLLFTRN